MSVRLTLVMACLSLALYLSGPGASLAAGPYQWNLDTVYDDRQHWGSALSALVLQIDALEGCTDRLGEGGDVLTDCLRSRFEAEGLSKRSRSWAQLQALDGAPGVETVENWNQALAPLRGTLERFDAAAARVGAPVVNALPVADLYRAWFTELWRNVAHAVWLEPGGPRVETVGQQGGRPWSRYPRKRKKRR